MKDYSFKINVWDILMQSSRKDSIHFEKKFSTLFPQLVDPWISCEIIVQWMDRSSLLVNIHNANAQTCVVCDKCSQWFTETLLLQEKEIKCFFDKWLHEEEDDIIYIHPKETQIDLEQYIVESFKLQEKISHVCTICEKNPEIENNENDWSLWWNISF